MIVCVDANEEVLADVTSSPMKIAAFMRTKAHMATRTPEPEERVYLTSLQVDGALVIGNLLAIPPHVVSSIVHDKNPDDKVNIIIHETPAFVLAGPSVVAPFATMTFSQLEQGEVFHELVIRMGSEATQNSSSSIRP